ncbi:MAG: sodium-dependent bicarbonate transport family permease [Gammaproteobacteria bacterium]
MISIDPIDPIVLFFILGLVAGLARSDLRLPGSIYEFLSVILLLAIGLKGGVELAQQSLMALLPQMIAVVMMGLALPLVAYPVLRGIGRFARADAASIAAHYGSASVGTYAVAVAWLASREITFEEYLPLLLVLLEMPAIVVGIMLARGVSADTDWRSLAHEVFLGKSIVLLVGGLLIGWAAGPAALEPVSGLFFGLFHGVLALFLLEMGLVAAGQFSSLRRHGLFLVAFGMVFPLFGALVGAVLGWQMGLSAGGTMLLATLAASASYIAVPAAMRMALPEANPALSLTASLGITFPFNILVGIPLYHQLAGLLHRLGG